MLLQYSKQCACVWIISFLCAQGFYLHRGLDTTCVSGARGSQKKAPDPLEIQMALNCQMGAENQIWALWKSSKCF